MRSLLLLATAALLTGAAPAKKLLTPTDVVNGAPASAWRTIQADDLLVMDLANGGRVVLQLAPQFAPVHVANIKALARSRNANRYGKGPPATEKMVQEAISLAERVRAEAQAWITEHLPNAPKP